MSLPQSTTPIQDTITSLNKANLRVISLVAMLGGWSLLCANILGYALLRDAHFINLIVLEIFYSACLTTAWVIQRRNHQRASAWIILISTFAIGIIFTYISQGLGLALGVMLAVIFPIIAWQTLPKSDAIAAVVLSLLTGVLIYFIDVRFAQTDRLASSFFLANLLIVLGGIVAFILVINGLRNMEFTSIGAQLRVSFLVVSLIPVLIISIFQIATLANVLTTQANNTLLENANFFASNFNSQLYAVTTFVEEDVRNPSLYSYFLTPNRDPNFLAGLASRYPSILSYGLLDKNGLLFIDDHGNAGASEANTTYFKNAAIVRITYISDVLLNEVAGRRVFIVSKPVINNQGELLGVLRVTLDADLFQKSVVEAARQFGAGFSVLVLDDMNIVLAHSTNPELISKTLSLPSRNLANMLQQDGRLLSSDNISANLDALEQALKKAKQETIFTSSIAPAEAGRDYIISIPVTYKPWKILVAQHTTVFLAPAFNQTISTALIILVLLAATYFGANLTTALLVTPVNRLTSVAQQLGSGKLDVPIDLPRRDELGTLAGILEHTRLQVYDLLQTLEQRVDERTSELTQVSEKNERRALQLETIAQVARAITSLRNLDQLLPEITQQICDSFGYYHAGVFLLDEAAEYAVLRAANSQGGQAMLKRGHRLRVGHQGIVGNVTNTGRPRIALDVGEDAVFFTNPDLPETRSEAALPLMIGDNIIGALDVQSTASNAFSEEDVKVLSLLSNQISVAIENARLFEETRQHLAQIQESFAEAGESGWRALVKETSTRGYRYAKGSVEALRRKTESTDIPVGETLEIPIMLRGEKLGELKIRRPGQQSSWDETEARMYRAVAERMSFALENARLFSDARRRANLERVAAEAATKIGSSVRIETILRTAAEEISRLMDGSEVLIQIQPEAIEKFDNK